jgi:uncharacterized delta-60 repeat protein
MKKLYNIIILLFVLQLSYAQQGILDTSFGDNGIQRASKLMYYNDTGVPRGTVKVLFRNNGTSTYLGNDLVNGGVLPVIRVINQDVSLKVWNKKTIVKDGIMDTNNGLFSTGYTQKEDNNKAIYVSKIKYGNITNSTGQGFSLDNNFNYDGKIVFDTKEIDEEAVAIKLQSDNKIVVLGFSGTKGIVIRYNTDGYLDRTFNQKGFHTFQIAQNTKPTSLEIQTDGKILVAGNCFNGNDIDFFITRLNTDGSVDNSFGTNGIVIKDVNNNDNTGNAMVLANDGSIYIGGKAYTVGGDFGIGNQFSYNFSVFKFNQNGSLDTSASNGILPGAFIKSLSMYQYTNPPTIVPDDEEVNCMAYDNVNERIYIYGYANKKSYDSQYNIITRKTGLWGFGFLLDNTFTPQNPSSFQFPTNYTDFETEIISATIKPSDMILGSANTKVYAVVKFENCTVGESTFVSVPSNTINTFPSSCNNNSVNLVLNKIEKINNEYYGLTIVNNYSGAGSYSSIGGDLYKLDANFNVINDFGNNGKIENVRDFKIDNDGKIICTLNSIANNGVKTLLTRFTSNGFIDNTFGVLGEIRTQNLINPFGIYVTPNNDYLVSFYKVSSSAQIVLEKYLNNGEKDLSFNPPSLLSITNFSSYPSILSSEDIISDNFGNIFTISYKQDVYNITNQIINLTKLNSTGNLDTSFGNNGVVNLLPFFNEPTNNLKLLRLNNGKILVYSHKRMIQLNIDGTLDTTFGNNGFIDVNSILSDFIISKIISNGSDYFIGGYRTNGGDSSTIIKINNIGIIDTNFAINGFYIDSDSNYLNVSYGLRNMYFEGLNKIVIHGGSIPIKRVQ